MINLGGKQKNRTRVFLDFFNGIGFSRSSYSFLLILTAASNYTHISNRSSDHAITKLKAKSTSCKSIYLNYAATPCASSNCSLYGRQALPIEPTARDKIRIIIKNTYRVGRIPGSNENVISKFKVRLTYLF